MDNNIASEIGSTLQAASVKRHPSPLHDINPSASISEQEPITIDPHADLDTHSIEHEDEIPISVLEPVARRHHMPPLPDLRFEQSYLKSIEHAQGWKEVLWITFRDQVFMCFTQGVAWTLILSGWRHWNRSAKFSGQSFGARIRRWWWGVNNWSIPTKTSQWQDRKFARNNSRVAGS